MKERFKGDLRGEDEDEDEVGDSINTCLSNPVYFPRSLSFFSFPRFSSE
jgi:hypothetical protein